jgi:class 3 adenylate cyclase
LDAHDSIVRGQLARYNGREVNTTGDGFLATFDGPARAIRCATEIIAAVRALGIEIRAGAHTGEVELRGNDIAGVAVNTAARVRDLTEPSEVLVSGTVVDLVAGSGITFRPRGEHDLRGIPGRWALFAVESE